ncbi:hypothetical protein FPQ18DRAFT_316855 [Pyronema domesticum]|nr:hypothetical protein FPQ18DRAFT_316855 [Pyronema domesticum]
MNAAVSLLYFLCFFLSEVCCISACVVRIINSTNSTTDKMAVIQSVRGFTRQRFGFFGWLFALSGSSIVGVAVGLLGYLDGNVCCGHVV